MQILKARGILCIYIPSSSIFPFHLGELYCHDNIQFSYYYSSHWYLTPAVLSCFPDNYNYQ